MGGVTNHINAFMLHLLKDQRDLLTEGPYVKALKVYWGEHCLTFELSLMDFGEEPSKFLFDNFLRIGILISQ